MAKVKVKLPLSLTKHHIMKTRLRVTFRNKLYFTVRIC